MKLLTHNMLTSSIIKGVSEGFPLIVQATKVEDVEADFNPEFVKRMIPKLKWFAVAKAAQEIGRDDVCPPEVPKEYEDNEEFLKQAHHILLEVDVIEGHLVCPESERKFPIKNGIPNMLLEDSEK